MNHKVKTSFATSYGIFLVKAYEIGADQFPPLVLFAKGY